MIHLIEWHTFTAVLVTSDNSFDTMTVVEGGTYDMAASRHHVYVLRLYVRTLTAGILIWRASSLQRSEWHWNRTKQHCLLEIIGIFFAGMDSAIGELYI